MEFDEIIVKDTPGLCRCCLSEGCYKDLATEYTWMSDTEVYADMLLECFDISISQHTEGPNGPNRLICEVCITRLRDACNFKKQVVEAETKFVDMMAKGDFRSKVMIVEPPPMKAEVHDEVHLEGATAEFLDDDIDFDVDDDKDDSGDDPSYSGDITVDALPVKNKRGRPRKNTTIVKSEKKSKVAKLEEKPRTSKVKDEKNHISQSGEESDMSSIKRNRLMKSNAMIVLEFSTVMPFKWHRQNYLCFFCHKYFTDIQLLKVHTVNDHKKSKIKSAVSYLRRDEKVKIDACDITCRLCGLRLENLDDLIEHLKVVHDKIFNVNSNIGVIPYKLLKDEFQCAICGEQFQYFVKLNEHMNKHYGNWICEICGKSFLSPDRLRCHSLSHNLKIKCKQCPEMFKTLKLKNQHNLKIHNKVVTIQCNYCNETFQDYAKRKLHHNMVHNIAMTKYKCTVCDKLFTIKSRMIVHMNEVHLKEKKFSCVICKQKFFSSTHLSKHMIKHSGERIHKCTICEKSYARKQTLRDHMKIHDTHKRYKCDICSETFVQNNNLKTHLKMHSEDD